MKKFLFIILIVAFFSKEGKAQEKLNFGIKGGINLTNLTSDNFAENNTKTGYYFGILTEFPLSNKFSIQPEVLYATQGTNAKVIMIGSGPKSEEYTLDYIQIPLLAKIYLIQNFSIDIGPSFNFLVNEKVPSHEEGLGNSFEFGGNIGLSYRLNSGPFVNIRYTKGLTNVFDKEAYLSSSKNNGIQLGIGFLF